MRRPGLSTELEPLLELSLSDSKPLLLELAQRQAARRTCRDLLAQWERDSFVRPSPVDQRTLVELDRVALDVAAFYEPLQLSPVAPLGNCSVLGPTSQDRTLSAGRGTEVISDPTNALALVCARRLKESPSEAVRLCTVHQTLRAQPLPKGRGFTQHFHLFALVDAGPGLPEDGFEVEAIASQLVLFERLVIRAEDLGYRFGPREVVVHGLEGSPSLRRMTERVRRALRDVEVTEGEPPPPYYEGLRVSFNARTRCGKLINLGDVGRFDWAAQLTANRKQRFVAGGFGLQLVPLIFHRDPI